MVNPTAPCTTTHTRTQGAIKRPADATLMNAKLVRLSDTRAFLAGYVYGDLSARFRDGDYIHTSLVTEEFDDGMFLTKTGTLYKVEFAT